MSDLRNQINSLSPAEKANCLIHYWESLEADSVSLTDAQRAELEYRIAGMSKTLRMSSPGRKSGRAFSRSRDAAGRLDSRSK